jgi:hypothetical protein
MNVLNQLHPIAYAVEQQLRELGAQGISSPKPPTNSLPDCDRHHLHQHVQSTARNTVATELRNESAHHHHQLMCKCRQGTIDDFRAKLQQPRISATRRKQYQALLQWFTEMVTIHPHAIHCAQSDNHRNHNAQHGASGDDHMRDVGEEDKCSHEPGLIILP